MNANFFFRFRQIQENGLKKNHIRPKKNCSQKLFARIFVQIFPALNKLSKNEIPKNAFIFFLYPEKIAYILLQLIRTISYLHAFRKEASIFKQIITLVLLFKILNHVLRNNRKISSPI